MSSDDDIVRDFALTMRGYDRNAVDQHMRRTAAVVDGLRNRVGELEGRLAAAREAAERSHTADPSPSDRFEALGAEAARILTAAEESANEMRATAARQADAEVAAAERAARERIDGATQHAARLVADGEQQRDAVLTDAEERRLAVEDEIARLAGVRDQLVDDLRAAVATTVDVVAGLTPAQDVDEEARTADPSEVGPPPDVDEAATSDRAAETVRDGTASEARPRSDEPEDAVGDATAGEAVASSDEPAVGSDAVGADEVVADTAGVSDDTPRDDLREDDAEDDGDVQDDGDVEDDRDVEDDGDGEGPTDDAEAAAQPGPERAAAVLAGSGVDRGPAVPPTLRREQSLAPVGPVLVRRLRRGLQDLQNGVLRAVRDRGDEPAESLLPAEDAVTTLAGFAVPFLEDGHRAGVADARDVTAGPSPGDPVADTDVVAEAAGALASDLVDELRTTLLPSLRAGIEADEPGASLSERVGEVFRDLKGPIVETVVDRHLVRVHGRATLATWRAAGIAEVAWVVGDEARCPEGRCRTNAAEGPVALGEPFPSGHALPPVHDGCTCALGPP